MKFPLRYLVHGLVDGMVTGFGAVLGASISGNVSLVLITGGATAVSCAIADIASIYTSTEASLLQEFVDLSDKMGIDKKFLKNSKIFSRKKQEIFRKSIIDAIACLIGGLILLIPFIIFPDNIQTAVLSLLPMTLIILGFLGWYIARISKEKALHLVLKLALVGFVAFVATFLITRVISI